jgi:hypothetical protein
MRLAFQSDSESTMNLHFYRDSLNDHGMSATLYHAAYRAANQFTRLAVWNGLSITPDRVESRFRTDPKRTHGRMLEAAAMRAYAKGEANGLSERFLDEAVAKGDRCFAFFEGDVLTSYGWYSTQPTRLTEISDSLVLSFDPKYVYMYNGFTLPKHRGQRLHALGMAAALEAYAKEGHKGLVSYVDSTNFASLKSCYRMGYRTFGHVVLVKVGKQYLCRSTPGCKDYDFRVEQTAN